ncbi:putative DNA-binding protein [Hoylesella marshii DSM 16973 = JCM 13450]|uniref:DNA-binding protein n=2 Tax=Hoylesella marshii TaxID=189722 RepID=E0NUA2_9BACT|nr:putative DNA-binding protein [Hoylesella marshii DSM 16973 = JCM 13450]
MPMANKPLQFFVQTKTMNVGPNKGQEMQTAIPTGRKRVDFRNFCKQVAKNTTFSEREVAAMLNEAVSTARDIVANGDSVEFGDMGTLTPSFRSHAVPKGKPFHAAEHIVKPVVRLTLSRKYFELKDVSFEQVPAPAKKEKKKP